MLSLFHHSPAYIIIDCSSYTISIIALTRIVAIASTGFQFFRISVSSNVPDEVGLQSFNVFCCFLHHFHLKLSITINVLFEKGSITYFLNPSYFLIFLVPYSSVYEIYKLTFELDFPIPGRRDFNCCSKSASCLLLFLFGDIFLSLRKRYKISGSLHF